MQRRGHGFVQEKFEERWIGPWVKTINRDLSRGRLTEYCGVTPLCFDGCSEGSEEWHNLIDFMATARLKKVGLIKGLSLSRVN